MKKLYIVELSIAVAILNIFDGIFTSFGVTQKFIDELNPLMRHLTLNSPTLFLAIKFLLSILIIFIAYKIFKSGTIQFKKWFYFGLIGVFVIYTGIFSIHIYWISQI